LLDVRDEHQNCQSANSPISSNSYIKITTASKGRNQKGDHTVKSKMILALALTFVFCCGSLVFAQNTNANNGNANMASNTGKKMSKRRRSRRRRRRRRHSRKSGGNMNSNMSGGNANGNMSNGNRK
jgi:hypothetical protein